MNVPSRLPYACVALLIASCAAAQQQGPKPGSGSAKTLKQAAIPQCSNGGVGSNCFVLLGPKNELSDSYCLRPKGSDTAYVRGIQDPATWYSQGVADPRPSVVQLGRTYTAGKTYCTPRKYVNGDDRIEILRDGKGGYVLNIYTRKTSAALPQCQSFPYGKTSDCYDPRVLGLQLVPDSRLSLQLYLTTYWPAQDVDIFIMFADQNLGRLDDGNGHSTTANYSPIEKYYRVEFFPHRMGVEPKCDAERPDQQPQAKFVLRKEFEAKEKCGVMDSGEGQTSGGGQYPPDYP